MTVTKDRLLTREQIHYLVPHEKRDGKYQCPVCRLWHFDITKSNPPKFSCKTPQCQGAAGHDAIVKCLWEEVDRREEKRQQQHSASEDSGEPSGKLTLAEYGIAKNLSAQTLIGMFGLTEGKHPYLKLNEAVCMPYWDENGKEVTQQWRWGMGKKERRYLHKRIEGPHTAACPPLCGHTYLYGGHFSEYLERLAAEGQSPLEIFLVEGESNTQTLWQFGIAAFGLPGVGNWNKDWAKIKSLEAAKNIYFLLDMKVDADGAPIEPEEAAMLGARKVADSFPNGKVLAMKLPVKDVSQLWLNCTTGFGAQVVTVHNVTVPIPPTAQMVALFQRMLGEAKLSAIPVIPATKPDAPVSEIELTSADEVEPVLIEWLWPNRIPLGKFTLFYGLPDQGKSTVTIDIIAKGSTGRCFHDCENPLPAFDTIVLAAEDDQDDTYVPRLMAAGADLKRVHFADMVLSGSESQTDRAIALDRDLVSLERMLEKHPDTRLLVIDPISAYLGEKDQNKDKEVRPLLAEIKALSKRTRVTVIGLTHFNKNADQAAIHRASGAGAWAQVPRSLWAFVPAPIEEEIAQGQDFIPEHLMLNGKLNITEQQKKAGLRYDFESVPVKVKNTRTGEWVETAAPRIKWLGRSTVTLASVMKEAKHSRGPEAVKTNEAIEWLNTYLAEGAKPSKRIDEAGLAKGFSKDTLYEAKKRAGIKAGKRGAAWYWWLEERPEAAPENGKEDGVELLG